MQIIERYFGMLEVHSPEQAEARSAEADARSDVFGLGAIAYHMFCGERPFPATSAMAAAIWDLVRALDMLFWVSGAVMRVYLVANRTLITSEK